jgi:hypothetical protein
MKYSSSNKPSQSSLARVSSIVPPANLLTCYPAQRANLMNSLQRSEEIKAFCQNPGETWMNYDPWDIIKPTA